MAGYGGNTRKGERNKRTLALQVLTERMISKGVLPLEYMLKVLRAPDITKDPTETDLQFKARQREDTELRLEAARLAAPYVHPKIAQEITLGGNSNEGDSEQPINLVDVARGLAFLFAKATAAPVEKQIN